MKFDIAYSTCPNDTFIFHALLHGLIHSEHEFESHLGDVEELNLAAFAGEHAITKLSFHALLKLKNKYTLLDAGAALGFGCGPMLVASNKDINLKTARIAVPGRYTTALMLLKLWQPEIANIEVVRFDKILPGVADGTFDAGLIIHEGRFVYGEYGLGMIVDLGHWWEETTGCPIPLGCIAIRNDLLEYKESVEELIAKSVRYAFTNPLVSMPYIKEHAQELDDDVIRRHIELYVNDFSVSLGETGRQAVRKLEEMCPTDL